MTGLWGCCFRWLRGKIVQCVSSGPPHGPLCGPVPDDTMISVQTPSRWADVALAGGGERKSKDFLLFSPPPPTILWH